jgi:hypothetical protein
VNPYAGDEDNFPANVLLPDDSDPPKAATFNPAPQGLADRTMSLANGYRADFATLAALKAVDTTSLPNGAIRSVFGYGRFVLQNASVETAQDPVVLAPTSGPGRWVALDDEAKRRWAFTFTANLQSVMIPSCISHIFYEGFGCGGGGGGGGNGQAGGACAGGGGGGAGAQLVVGECDVTSGATASCSTLGGGAGGAATADGTDGDDMTIEIGALTLIFPGAQGGRGGNVGTGTTPFCVPGGSSAPAGSPKLKNFNMPAGDQQQVYTGPGAGGWSGDNFLTVTPQTNGARSLQGLSGGAIGVSGAPNTNPGGAGGGGGGAGPSGAGGHGGNGGAGAAAGAGVNGTVGVAAPTANSGAGGGGGGAGGNGSTGGSVGGAGGAGATGSVTIRGAW